MTGRPQRIASAPANTNEIPMNRVQIFFCMVYSLVSRKLPDRTGGPRSRK
jgi:hypothetical protein